jgi:hypothetical protein
MSEGIEPYDPTTPVHLLVSITETFVGHDTAEWRARRERREAERTQQEAAATMALVRAMDRWEDLWDSMAENLVATSVLLIHKPVVDIDHRVVCTHCEQHNGYEDTEPVPWPCSTYAAVLEAVQVPVSEPQGGVD